MEVIRQLLATFAVGGVLSVIGQGFFNMYTVSLGDKAMLAGPLTLVTLGFIGALLFVFKVYQKIEKFAGFGAMLPFSGLAAAVAGSVAGAKAGGATMGKAISSGIMLVVYVVGLGTLFSVIVGVIAFFAG